jgi:hypothetical protein
MIFLNLRIFQNKRNNKESFITSLCKLKMIPSINLSMSHLHHRHTHSASPWPSARPDPAEEARYCTECLDPYRNSEDSGNIRVATRSELWPAKGRIEEAPPHPRECIQPVRHAYRAPFASALWRHGR